MRATVPNTPLGGFEERLLTELRAHVAQQQLTVVQPPATRPAALSRPVGATAVGRRWQVPIPRVTIPVAAVITALVTGVLTLLPAASPTLAQAYPILTGRPHELPARLVRVLRHQWMTGTGPRFDLRHAYAFRTPSGTGYVIVDQRAKWLCVLVPGFAGVGANGRCERVAVARLGRRPLELRINGSVRRQEIVALLPRGAAASARTASGPTQRLAVHRGVLAVLSRGPVTVTTTLTGGQRTRMTYRP
jgi:hypothetical protein